MGSGPQLARHGGQRAVWSGYCSWRWVPSALDRITSAMGDSLPRKETPLLQHAYRASVHHLTHWSCHGTQIHDQTMAIHQNPPLALIPCYIERIQESIEREMKT
ncbi:hypothetical protein Sjap_024314 [Stephania japonica]|uniref:Uncharacterized protein n=1 Tax=Stephania japonica TaxID=461633 RepID=A0AAP0HNL2_9MAGN